MHFWSSFGRAYGTLKGCIPLKSNLTAKEKVNITVRYINGEISRAVAAREAAVDQKAIANWALRYREEGEDAFLPHRNNRYTPETKNAAVAEYLHSNASTNAICEKYGIRSAKQLYNWVQEFRTNGNIAPTRSSGGSYNRPSRDVSPEEREEIAKDCISTGKKYSETAKKYNVGYQQVRSWVLRYEEEGSEDAPDLRKKNTAAELNARLEELSEENKQLRQQLDSVQRQLETMQFEISKLKRFKPLQ